MKYKYITGPLAVALIAIPLATACHGTTTASPQAKASVSALASVPGADARQILITAGVPINGNSAKQIAFGKAMLVKANREALAKKLAIPAQNKMTFEANALTAAKADDVFTHAGCVKFFDTDLPNLYTAALVVKS